MTEPRPSTAPLAAGFPHVQGRCPACRWASLFLGSGGHVTCARIDCPDPCAADWLPHGEGGRTTPDSPPASSDAADNSTLHDGPTVAELAANDRNWDVEKGGA